MEKKCLDYIWFPKNLRENVKGWRQKWKIEWKKI